MESKRMNAQKTYLLTSCGHLMFACGVGKDMTKGFVPPAASFIGLLEVFAKVRGEPRCSKSQRVEILISRSIDSGKRLSRSNTTTYNFKNTTRPSPSLCKVLIASIKFSQSFRARSFFLNFASSSEFESTSAGWERNEKYEKMKEKESRKKRDLVQLGTVKRRF